MVCAAVRSGDIAVDGGVIAPGTIMRRQGIPRPRRFAQPAGMYHLPRMPLDKSPHVTGQRCLPFAFRPAPECRAIYSDPLLNYKPLLAGPQLTLARLMVRAACEVAPAAAVPDCLPGLNASPVGLTGAGSGPPDPATAPGKAGHGLHSFARMERGSRIAGRQTHDESRKMRQRPSHACGNHTPQIPHARRFQLRENSYPSDRST